MEEESGTAVGFWDLKDYCIAQHKDAVLVGVDMILEQYVL